MIYDDEFPLLVSDSDHTYRQVSFSLGKAVYNEYHGDWVEYHGDEYLNEGDVVKEAYISYG